MNEKSKGGKVAARRAESVTITRMQDNQSVVILFELLTENLNAPVQHVYYALDPDTARDVAASIVDNADKVEAGEE